MKAIMVMFDSLNRRYLPPYGNTWVKAPNFTRLAEKTVTFDCAYVGSMPCMPARREIHTGRYNFLHRSWGPLEPFDDSMPEILKKNNIYTHLVSDHYHYWEDGGATYHTRYSSWELSRGQEGDPWKGEVRNPDIPKSIGSRNNSKWRQDWVNRKYLTQQDEMPQAKTFSKGLEFIKTNSSADNWFLTIETFDPHEPFYTLPAFQKLYPHHYDGNHFDWPEYGKAVETEDQINHIRMLYAALTSMCDHYLGQVLDAMDKYDLWKDTMLIVNTDHGYLLGEHGMWAKSTMPFYEEIGRMPLFIWDPREKKQGERRNSLVQTIDLAPTLLDFFNLCPTPDMQGRKLRKTIECDQPVREAALFGLHGLHVNCTDGRYVYMRAPQKKGPDCLFEYTLMPTHMREPFAPEELRHTTLSKPFSFTKGCPVLKIPANPWPMAEEYGTFLFDLQADPNQSLSVSDSGVEEQMVVHLKRLMKEGDAPEELYERLGLK